MLKRNVSGIMLTLLLISMLTLAFNIQPVKAEPPTGVVSVGASPDPFSPNNDGIKDTSMISVTADTGQTLFVNIYNESNTIQRTGLPLTELDESGYYEVQWNGTNDSGEIVSDGEYEIRVSTSNDGSQTNESDVTGSVDVDTIPPVPLIVEPDFEEIVSGIVSIIIIELPNPPSDIGESPPPDAVSVLFDYSLDRSNWTSIGIDNDGSDGWRWNWNTDPIPEGTCYIMATMVDDANNTGQVITPIIVDRSTPRPWMEEGKVSPQEGVEGTVFVYDVTYYDNLTTPIQYFEEPVNLSSPSSHDMHPRKIVDSEGDVHIVWMSDRDGQWEIYYKEIANDGTILVGGKRISDLNSSNSMYPSIALDSDDDVYLDGGEHRYALLVAPNRDGIKQFKYDITMMREYLLKNGYTDENITFLTTTSYKQEWIWDYENNTWVHPTGWNPTTKNETWIDGDATKSNLINALNNLASKVNSGDLVFIELRDHGATSSYADGTRSAVRFDPVDEKKGNDEYFKTTPDKKYTYDDELDQKLDNINCNIVVVVDSCCSGGFINRPNNDCSGKRRLVVTSAEECKKSWRYGYRFYERIQDPAADANGNGKISVEEAHSYTVKNNRINTETVTRNQVYRGYYNPKTQSYDPGTNTITQNPQIDDQLSFANAHVVWADERDGNWEIYYSTIQGNTGADFNIPDLRISSNDGKDSGRVIMNPVDSESPSYIEHPDIAVDSFDLVHIVWSDYRDGQWEVYYQCQTNVGITVIDDTRISDLNSSNSQCPAIAVGKGWWPPINIAWQDYRDGNWEIYYEKGMLSIFHPLYYMTLINDKRVTSGTDSKSERVNGYYKQYFDATDDDSNSTMPDIAVDWSGYVHIVFMDQRPDDPGPGDYHIDDYWEIYTLALDPNGNKQWEHRQSDMNGGSWHGTYTGPPDGYSMYPRIVQQGGWAYDSSPTKSTTHITWHDNRDGNWEIYYSEMASACNNPETDVRITKFLKDDMYPDIALNRKNEPDVVWQHKNTNWRIYHARWNGSRWVRVVIGGFPYNLYPLDPYDIDATDGITYVFGLPLSAKPHNYSFNVNNGYLTASLPAVSGPIVYIEEWIVNNTETRDGIDTKVHGNLTILSNGNLTLTNSIIKMNGNITIMNGGKLWLNNTTIIMDCTYDGQYHIEVKSGGEMHIYDGDGNHETTYDRSNITSWNPDHEYLFWVRKGSKFEMMNSELHECGYEWGFPDGLSGLLIETDNVTIDHCIISHNYRGLILNSSSNNNIISCDIHLNSDEGIFLHSSSNNTVKNCNLLNNSIALDIWNSPNNIIEDCNISNNNNAGVYLYCSPNSTIKNCIIDSNGWCGIHPFDSNNTIITNCKISNNEYGINIEYSSNVLITNCKISNNTYGIGLYSSSNHIYHNDFISNAQQVEIWAEFLNTWDDGYPSGGNYWSDYEERYPYAEEIDESGIWDTPYVIDENNQDNYPLMNPYIGQHDIAITDVTPSKTIVGQGYNALINATVENQGDFTETSIQVTAYANDTAIQTLTIPSLALSEQTTVTFTWNTTGFAKGNYTITAYAEPVPGETETADNTYIDNWIVVTIPGDVDGDFDVDLYDAVKLLVVYGAKKDNPKYDPNCDIDGDGDIDLYDAVRLLTHYGQKDP